MIKEDELKLLKEIDNLKCNLEIVLWGNLDRVIRRRVLRQGLGGLDATTACFVEMDTI